MTRQIIDIGTVGNDGTGDSIRDSFRKVNDNFRELYGSLGLGERLTFLNLSDTPDRYDGQEGSILTVKAGAQGGLQVGFKQLVEGAGIRITNDPDSNDIVFDAEFSSIVSDPNPRLGGDLSVISQGQVFRILDLGTPVRGDEAANKSYTDSKISLAGTETVDPASGTVRRSAGEMTGPLVLSRDPLPQDDTDYDGRIAATKRYVDQAGFASKINLFVAMSGEDDRPGVPLEVQGRSLAYAYKTLEAALKRAEEIVELSDLDIGPYRKTLTYNNGANFATLEGILESPDSGTGFSGRALMSVDTISINVNGDGYKVGDRIRLTGGIGAPAIYEVVTVRDEPGPILSVRQISSGLYSAVPGSTAVTTTNISSEFGRSATFNVTYKVNNIEILDKGGSQSTSSPPPPNNYRDYGLVSVRITGGGGTGAFGIANVQNGQIDGITITDQGRGFTNVPTVTVNLPRMLIKTEFQRTDATGDTLTNTAGAFRTRDIREGLFLLGETSGALAQILSHGPTLGPPLGALGLDSDGNEIFDIDIVRGSFQEGERIAYGDSTKNIQISILIESGIYEENLPLKLPQNVALIGDEFRRVIIKPRRGVSSSPYALDKFRRDIEIDSLIVAQQLFGYHYLTDASQPIYPKINNKGKFRAASALIKLNKAFLQEEVIAWIEEQISAANGRPSTEGSPAIPPDTGSIWFDFEYNKTLCQRDLGLIIDSIAYDLLAGSYNRTVSAALKYYGPVTALGDPSIAIGAQLNQTVASIEKLEEYLQLVIKNIEIQDILNTEESQIIDAAFISEPGTGALSNVIINATQSSPIRITTETAHNYVDKELVTITDVLEGMTELNGRSYYAKVINNTTLDLYEDFNLTEAANSIGFSAWAIETTASITPQGGVIGQLFDVHIDIISGSSVLNLPKNNDQMDVFLCNDANIIRAMTIQGHGGFAMVLDPVGQILAKSPYAQECASFSKSINAQTFAGGMFVDGFTGNLQFLHTDSDDGFNIKVSNLEREPNIPCSFIVNDRVYRINYFRNYVFNPLGSTADFVLDETTPFTFDPGGNDFSFTVASPAVFTSTRHSLQTKSTIRFITTGTLPSPLEENKDYYIILNGLTDNQFQISEDPLSITGLAITDSGTGTHQWQRVYELLMPGNRSMLSNDFTQVCDLGYGLIATNGGLTEAVSMFTYYCHISYYSLNGGQIRSVAGSSAQGNFALVAEGADPLEVPTPVTIYEPSSQRVTCYAASATYETTVGGQIINVTGYRDIPRGGSELEINHDGTIVRYPVTSAELDSIVPGVYRLNLSAEQGIVGDGLLAVVPDGTKMTLRSLGLQILTGDVVGIATRPSTGLVLKETPNRVYRVLSFDNYQDPNGPYEIEYTATTPTDISVLLTINSIGSDICTTIGNHVLEIGDIIVPKSTTNGLTQNTIYYINTVPSYDSFTVSTIPPASFKGSINGTLLIVTEVFQGTISVGHKIQGLGIVAGTEIVALGSGTGEVGTYTVNNSQTVSSTSVSAAANDVSLSNGNNLNIKVKKSHKLVPNYQVALAPANFIGTGSISGFTLSINTVTAGKIYIGMVISGLGITAGTTVTAYQSGSTGGIGNYTVSISQSVLTTNISEDGRVPNGILASIPNVPAIFNGSITDTILQVDNIISGQIQLGQVIKGSSVLPGTTIDAFGTGTGAEGTYIVSLSQEIGSRPLRSQSEEFGEPYFVITEGLTETEFRISLDKNGTPINLTEIGQGPQIYSPYGLTLTQLRENYQTINLTLFQPGEYAEETQIIQSITSGTTTTITKTGHGLSAGDVIKFTLGTGAALPSGISTQRNWFVISDGLTLDTFRISTTPGGTVIETSGSLLGNVVFGRIRGRAGDNNFIVVPVPPQERSRLINSVFYAEGERYTIVKYETEGELSQPYARVTLNRPLVDSLINFVGSYTIKASVPLRTSGAEGLLTVRISLTRVTGHDLLDIGTGSYADTNYPNEIYGPPVNPPDPKAETVERTVGRVFYVTTDQFGNFRVGPYFSVDQGTGTVTFSAAIALSNLDGLGFKRGVPISEFSTDSEMLDNATDTVPTENAVRGYLDRRLGVKQDGIEVVADALLLPQSVGGFMPLLPPAGVQMKGDMDLGGFNIKDLANPREAQDAVNLRSLTFNNFQDVTLNVSGPNSGEVLGFTGENNKAISLTIAGDVTATRTAGTLNLNINAGTIRNDEIAADAAIDQSKLNLSDVTTLVGNATTTVKGLASFDQTKFIVSAGAVTIQNTVQRSFTATLSGTELNVTSAVTGGSLQIGHIITGTGLLTNTRIIAFGSGTGGAGTYTVNQNYATALSSRTMQATVEGIELTNLTRIGGRRVLGYSGTGTPDSGSVEQVLFTTVVDQGEAVKKSQYSEIGSYLKKTGAGTADGNFTTVLDSANWNGASDSSKLVIRSGSGDFGGRFITADEFYTNAQETLGVRTGKKALTATSTALGRGHITLHSYSGDSSILIFNQAPGGPTGDAQTLYRNNTHRFELAAGGTVAPVECGQLSSTRVVTTQITTGAATTEGTITGRWILADSPGGASRSNSRLQATYSADLAEFYEGDQEYEVGTVLIFGGEKEVTISKDFMDTRVAGVVSDNAAYSMYGACPGLKNQIALQGRVDTKVVGKIRKGDILVTSDIPGVATSVQRDIKMGTMIGKALEEYDSDQVGMIQVSVGRT